MMKKKSFAFSAETAPDKTGMAIADADHAQAREDYLRKYLSDVSVKQILIVSHTDGSNALAFFYEKDAGANSWTLVFQADAFIGKNGMGKEREGDARTPYGDYEITGAFGILGNPGTAFNYIDVTPTTFACDEDCEYYNRIIDTAVTGHDCKGEEMYHISPEYDYGLTTSYNAENRYPDGSAIFVHCKGQKTYTGGCIALNAEDMITILEKAEPGMRIYLDEY